MANKLDPISFRPTPDVAAAIAKIQAVNADEYFVFTATQAITKAVLEYAKTLPDPPKVVAPMKVE